MKKRLIWEYLRMPFNGTSIPEDKTQMQTFYCYPNDKLYPGHDAHSLFNRKNYFGHVNVNGEWKIYSINDKTNKQETYLSGKENTILLAKKKVKNEFIKFSTFFD